MSEPNENDQMTEDKLDKLIQNVVKKPRGQEGDSKPQDKDDEADQGEVTIELGND